MCSLVECHITLSALGISPHPTQYIVSCLRDSYETISRESLLSHKLPVYSTKSYGLWHQRLLRSLGKRYMCINYCQRLS